MPTVSIITALYNHEAYIAQAIESVLAQSYLDWEYLIWDDGSSDKSLEIASSFSQHYPDKIKVFTHINRLNLGQEKTRNAALTKALGSLICILDSDDLYHTKKLEWLVPCFQNTKVGLAYGKMDICIEKTGLHTQSHLKKYLSGKVYEPLLFENFIGAASTLFRKECLKTGCNFDTRYKTMGEYPLWLEIAKNWEVAFIPHVVCTWRKHEKNLGTQLALQAKLELVDYFENLMKQDSAISTKEIILRALIKRRYDYASLLYFNLNLPLCRQQLSLILKEPMASAELKLKASLLFGVSSLGTILNYFVRQFKTWLWKIRHDGQN